MKLHMKKHTYSESKFTYENRIILIIFILFTYEITYKKHTYSESKFTYENRIFLIIFILFTYEITYEKTHL